MHRGNHQGAQALTPTNATIVSWSVFLLLLTSSGCRNSLEEVSDFETLDNEPAQTIEGADMEYSEEGILTHRLRASYMERNAEEEAAWDVRGGFDLQVLDKSGGEGAILHADGGRFEEVARHLEARGAVQLIGPSGDTLLTELLFWSADSDRVHTPARVEVRTAEGTLLGTGLESDARFERYRILRPTGTFHIDTTKTTAS